MRRNLCVWSVMLWFAVSAHADTPPTQISRAQTAAAAHAAAHEELPAAVVDMLDARGDRLLDEAGHSDPLAARLGGRGDGGSRGGASSQETAPAQGGPPTDDFHASDDDVPF